MSHTLPKYPWQIVSMDVFFTKYNNKQCKVLVTVDFFEINFLKDLTPDSVTQAMRENFSRYGVPKIVCTHNGTNFVNHLMKDLAVKEQFRHVTSSPLYSRENGKAESAVKVAKNVIKKAEDSKQDFKWALVHWRNIPNKTGFSPAQHLMSRNTRNGVPTTIDNYLPKM